MNFVNLAFAVFYKYTDVGTRNFVRTATPFGKYRLVMVQTHVTK